MVKDIIFAPHHQAAMFIEPVNLSKRIVSLGVSFNTPSYEEEKAVPSMSHETLHMVLSKVSPKSGKKLPSGMHPEQHRYVMSIDRPDIGGYLSEIGPSGLPEIDYIVNAENKGIVSRHINPRLRRLLE